MSCGVGHRHSLVLALRLWHKLAAIVPTQPLHWEFPYAMGVALKKKKRHETIKPLEENTGSLALVLVFFAVFCFLGLQLQHMEIPRLGVKSELQLPAYTTVTKTWDLSRVCDLHHSSWQHGILNPLSKARDQTHVLMDASRVC